LEEVMIRQTVAAAPGWRACAHASWSGRAALVFVFVCIFAQSAVGAELELRYYGATWCAPCHKVEPMVDRWAAEHPGLRVVKLDYDANKTDRLNFDLVGVPMLVLLDGDRVVAKYGEGAQRISDFAYDRLEWWYESVRERIDTARQ
jgi:thiol-disulfide isomerase/thioredoxin